MSHHVRAGYMGLAKVGSTTIRCTSFSVNTTQDLSFYNHVIGLRDTVPSGNATKGEGSATQIQRKIWRPSPISIGGGIGFPATETSLSTIFDLAKRADYFDTVFKYHCAGEGDSNNPRTFKDCRINSFDLSVTAGDIVNVSMDVLCKKLTIAGSSSVYTVPQKLLTWDKIKVTADSITDYLIQGFSLKINNNLQNIYTTTATTTYSETSPESLLPTDIRVGMQEVTGSLSVYLASGQRFITGGSTVININFSSSSLSFRITAVYKPSQLEGAVGPIITQVPFVGVDTYFI